MVTTRSATASTRTTPSSLSAGATPTTSTSVGAAPSRANGRRKATTDPEINGKSNASPPKKKVKSASVEVDRPLLDEAIVTERTTVPAPHLPFNLQKAIQHLTQTDARFTKLLKETNLKPFTEMDEGRVQEINVFKYLGHSILGQQISWKAARSVIYKFVRLFFPDLPEDPNFGDESGTKQAKREDWPWPTPHQVLRADETTFRSAGLSGQKIKYVIDAAKHFADGRLDARTLLEAEEQDAVDTLVNIKGVGVWTAEMLLIFALRKPNLLPVGDLGIQRGMLLFFAATTVDVMVVHPGKYKKGKGKEDEATKFDHHEEEMLFDRAEKSEKLVDTHQESKVEPPSSATKELPPLPEGLSLPTLRNRANGNKVKGQYLTPEEMRKLAGPWEPYRSVGSYLMYALKD